MKNFKVKPANKEMIEEVIGEPLPYTSHVFAVSCDDQLIGLIGAYRKQTYIVLYTHIEPGIQKELKKYRRGVILAYRKMMKLLKEQSLPVYSYADETVDGSDRLLTHIGFVPYNGRTYQWRGSDT